MTAERPAVIVIEDEPQLRRVLRTMLETNGFRCIESESARRGLLDAHAPSRGRRSAGQSSARPLASVVVLSVELSEVNLVQALGRTQWSDIT
jgi:DNA-binding response OmpR family regulator